MAAWHAELDGGRFYVQLGPLAAPLAFVGRAPRRHLTGLVEWAYAREFRPMCEAQAHRDGRAWALRAAGRLPAAFFAP